MQLYSKIERTSLRMGIYLAKKAQPPNKSNVMAKDKNMEGIHFKETSKNYINENI